MEGTGIICLLIIINTCIISYQAFKSPGLRSRLAFDVERIKVYKEYWRLVSSALVHSNWLHLIFNMLALYFFADALSFAGPIRFLLIYLCGIAGGDLFALFVHRHDSSYTSIGASGGVNAVIFAAIAIFPSSRIGLFLLPISIPGWLFALLYVGFSIYGIRSRRQNIGHDAHLGGGLAGVLMAILFYPSIVVENAVPLLVITLPIIAFIYIVITRPHLLLVDNLFYNNQQKLTIDQRYNLSRRKKELQLDEILDKIQKKGMQNLTKEELRKLKEYSEQL